MTVEAIQFSIQVTDDMWNGIFDHLEVFRSRLGASGPYEELTGPVWAPASFQVLAKAYTVNTKILALSIGTLIVKIIFIGADPISAASMATQIQAQGLGLITAFVQDTSLVIQTTSLGVTTTLTILPSDVAGILGLDTTQPVATTFGQDARLTLVLGKTTYNFTDPNGDTDFFYKVRFWNSTNGAQSDLSEPFQGTPTTTLEVSDLILGTIDLVDPLGRPAANVRILLDNRFSGQLVEDNFALVGGSVEQLTDVNGHAEFNLVRGAKLTVAIAGTNIARDITVPTDPTLNTFKLLDPGIAGPDVFMVQIPNIDYAVRRTL